MRTVFAAVSAVVLSLTGVSAADAETGVPVVTRVADLPLTGVTDAVLDPAHDQMFVSSRSEGRVSVADLTTGQVTRLPFLPEAGEMDLDDSGDHVWVSLRSEGAVARVSTVAPFEATIFPLGHRCPRDLVATGGTVYVVADDDCLRQWDELVMVDPETGEVTESTAEPGPFGEIYDPVLRQIPGTTRIFWQSYGHGDSGIVDAATDSPIATSSISTVLAVMPDGENLLARNGDLRSTTDLSLTGHLAVPPIPDQYPYVADPDPAITADGLLAYPADGKLVVYDLNSGTEVGRWEFDPVDGYGAGPTFWDESVLYGLGAGSPVQLSAVADVHAPRTSVLTVTEPEPGPIPRGAEVTVSGRLVDGSGSPVADAPIEIRATNTNELLASPVTAADGSWSAVVGVDWYTLRVLFPGDASHAAATAVLSYWFDEPRHFLSVDGPVTPAPSETLSYVGRVVDQQDQPLPDVDVNVNWQCGDRGFGGYVTTREDGTFRYETAAPRCAHLTVYFWVSGSQGSMGQPGNVVVETDIGWIKSELTAQGPDQVAPGETGTWTATLTVDGVPVPDANVLFRSVQSWGWEKASLTTDAQGVVTITTDAVHQDGRGVEFRYAGDSTTLGSTATVATRVAAWPSTLTVSPSSESPTAGDPLTFTGNLRFGNESSVEGRMVQVTDAYNSPIHTAPVAGDGSFSFTERPSAGPHTWNFQFVGDAQHAAATRSISLSVSEQTASLTTTRIADSSPSREIFQTTAAPAYADMCLRYRVDRRTPNGWRKVSSSGCRFTGEAGVARYRTSGDLAMVGRYRVRPTFAGDEFTAPTKGAWRRFRLG